MVIILNFVIDFNSFINFCVVYFDICNVDEICDVLLGNVVCVIM